MASSQQSQKRSKATSASTQDSSSARSRSRTSGKVAASRGRNEAAADRFLVLWNVTIPKDADLADATNSWAHLVEIDIKHDFALLSRGFLQVLAEAMKERAGGAAPRRSTSAYLEWMKKSVELTHPDWRAACLDANATPPTDFADDLDRFLWNLKEVYVQGVQGTIWTIPVDFWQWFALALNASDL